MKSPLRLLDDLESTIGEWVIRFRWLIIIASVLVVVVSGLGLGKAQLGAGYRPLFNADDEKLLALDALEAEFSKDSNLLFLIEPDNENVFTVSMMEIIHELTQASWRLPFATRVDSVTNFQHMEVEGDDLVVRDLVENPSQLSEQDLQNIKQIAVAEPALRGLLLSEKNDVTAVNVSFHLPDPSRENRVPEITVVDYANTLKQRFEEKYPDITIYITGQIPVDYTFYQVALDDGKGVIPLSMLLMLIIFLILSRSIVATALTAMVILCSIVIAVGTVAHFGIIFHTGNAAAPTIILTIASASCVHLLVSYLQYRKTVGDTHQAIVEALRLNFQPITLTSITTLVGFLSILLSDIPAFRVLSIVVTLGILASLFLVIFLLPALLSFFPNTHVGSVETTIGNVTSTAMERFGGFIVKWNRIIFYGMLTLILLAVAGIPQNELNDNFIQYFDKSIDFRKATDFADDNLAGIYVMQYDLDSGVTGGVNNPDYLAEVDKFGVWLGQQPEVLHVSSIVDVYKRLNKNLHSGDPGQYKIPENLNEAAQYLLLYEMSLPYGLDLNNQINLDKSKTKLSANVSALDSKRFIAFDRRVTQWLNENTSYFKEVHGLGPAILFSYKSLSNGKAMIMTTSIALIAISGLLIIMLRSLRIGLISLVPNLVPAIIGFGLWGVIDGEITIVLSLVMTMTLGIVVDDTVHFLSKYQRARREMGMNSEQAVIYSFKTVGQALVVTSLMLASGFFVLMQSDFMMNAEMGLLTGIIILAALIADFFFLPLLLIKLDSKKILT